MNDALIEFRNALEKNFGYLDWMPIADGNIHRFHVPGDKLGSRNGWYVMYTNIIPAGAFGSWRVSFSKLWSYKKAISSQNIKKLSQQAHLAKNERKRLRWQLNCEAAKTANKIWLKSQPADLSHPYLRRKKTQPYNLRQIGNQLLVPLFFKKSLVNIQRIWPSGEKRYLRGGRINGCFSLIATSSPSATIYICEGWATGATLFAETGHAVACAMSTGNLFRAGLQVQKLYPDARITIAADNDRKSCLAGIGNPGLDAAIKAASSLGCAYIAPEFPPCAPINLSDFNDLAVWGGVL